MIATVIFCIIGLIGFIPIWAVTESNSSSEDGCVPMLFGAVMIIIAVAGLYFCGTLSKVLDVVL